MSNPYGIPKQTIHDIVAGTDRDQRHPDWRKPRTKPSISKEFKTVEEHRVSYQDIIADRGLPRRALTPQQKSAVINRLGQLWLDHPDLRLAQLIGNVYPCGPAEGHEDPYHIEDFDFITRMEMRYE